MVSCNNDTMRVVDGVKRYEEEQLFEEDMRALLNMVRPNRRERLMGWNEHRTGGAHFRATISWSEQFTTPESDERFTIPQLADVLEAILIGSVRSELDLPLNEEFDLYRGVVRELYKRVNESQSSYE